jgi:hypothetical protein
MSFTHGEKPLFQLYHHMGRAINSFMLISLSDGGFFLRFLRKDNYTFLRGRRNCMVVGFTTTCAMSAYRQ